MGNVSDAIRKRQAEEAARAAAKAAEAASIPAEAPADRSSAAARPAPPEAPKPPGAAFVVLPRQEATSRNGYSPLLMVHHDRGGTIAEEYRALRTHLLTECGDRGFCYMLTSAEGGEGKTVTTFNLGLVMAERQDRRTILVDCDLRKGKLSGLIKAPRSPGLTDVIRGKAALADVIRPTVYSNLFLVPAGEVSNQEVGELVTRPELHETLAQLRKQYDYVLLDTAPVNIVAETAMIGRAVGDALVVVRMNKTSRDTVSHAIRLLRAAGVNVAGIVLTHRKFHVPRYLYRYRYA